jgi:membrane protease YdiL (CAAX protease family)
MLQPRAEAIAPVWHTVLTVLLVLGPLIQGILADGRNSTSANRPPSAVPFYLTGTVVLWVCFAFVWFGLRLRRRSLRDLVGERWTSARQAATDIALALFFWAFWYGVLSAVKAGLTKAGVSNSGASGMVYPKSGIEIGLWIVGAISAGFVEEFIFRGYLMKQFAFLCRSTTVGLVLQAALFGVAHGFYLGMRQVTLIAVSGMLIGALALWRQNLRSAMVFHAWADIFGAMIVRGLPFQ